MSGVVAFAGWTVALPALCIAAVIAHRAGRRMELVSRAAHEVRGPLTAARLAVHTLSREGRGSTDAVAALEHELVRAGRALDDLAAAREGRLAAGRDEFVDLGPVVRATVAAWRPVAEAHGVELRARWPREPVVVRGERTRLAQACANLLANAIEATALHAPAGAVVELRGRLTLSGVRVEVTDTGPGLSAPPAVLAASARGGRGRRGRGLAITAEIAARHGGRLSAAPSGRGARVALELPVAAGGALAGEAP